MYLLSLLDVISSYDKSSVAVESLQEVEKYRFLKTEKLLVLALQLYEKMRTDKVLSSGLQNQC